MKRKTLVSILVLLASLLISDIAYAWEDITQVNSKAKVLLDMTGEHVDNAYVEGVEDGGSATHTYHGAAQVTKNYEIYIPIGCTFTYIRNTWTSAANETAQWTSGDNKDYHYVYVEKNDGSTHVLSPNSTFGKPGNRDDRKYNKCHVKFLEEGTRNTPADQVKPIKINCKVGLTYLSNPYDSPADITVYVKRYGFKFKYYANGTQCDSVVTWWYDQTNNIPVSTTNSPSKEGYTFKGWNLGSESFSGGTTISSIELTNNEFYVTRDDIYGKDHHRYVEKNFYAQWEATPYTITYNANGGSCSISSETYTIESATRNTPTPSRWGYDFKGWKVVSAEKNWTLNDVYGVGIKQLAQGLYGNVTLEAQWEIKKFPVKTTFTSGKGSASTDQSITFNQNSTAVTINAAKNYRIKTVKVVMSVDGADIVKVDESYDPAVNPVSSYTVSAMKIEGETNITVTTERVSADVTIKRTGLQGDDSSIIKVTKQGESTAVYTIILNAAEPQVTLNQIPLGTYIISETNWAYTYNKASATQTITISSTDTEDKTITFEGAKKTSDRFSAEKHKSN